MAFPLPILEAMERGSCRVSKVFFDPGIRPLNLMTSRHFSQLLGPTQNLPGLVRRKLSNYPDERFFLLSQGDATVLSRMPKRRTTAVG